MAESTTSPTTSPMASPTASPTSPEARLREVKTTIESIKANDPVSPDTLASMETLLAKASDPSADIERLEVGARSLKKAQDRKVKAMELDEINFLFDIGDWATAIVDRIRTQEKKFQDGFAQAYEKELKESGMSGLAAREQVSKSSEWRALSGYQMEESYPRVEAELNEIENWRARGSDDGIAPETPVLDRLAKLCDDIPISYPVSVQILKIVKDRNFVAHRPPPRLDDHLKANGEIDWQAIWDQCKQCKTRLRDSYHAGTLTEKRQKLFEKTVDLWFSLHVRGWADGGDALETDFARVRKKNARDAVASMKRRKAASPPFTPYKRGKWEHFDSPDGST